MPDKNQTPNQATEKSEIKNPVSAKPIQNVSKHPSQGDLITHGTVEYDDDYIKSWLRSLTILHRGHWDAARYYDKVNFGLGIATAVSAAISGTTAFTQLQNQADQGGLNIWLQVGVGVFALTAASLGAAQAFVRPSELAARHKQAGQKFGKLRREIELHLNLGLPGEYDSRKQLLTEFRLRWDAVDEESLPIPERIYNKIESEFANKLARLRTTESLC